MTVEGIILNTNTPFLLLVVFIYVRFHLRLFIYLSPDLSSMDSVPSVPPQRPTTSPILDLRSTPLGVLLDSPSSLPIGPYSYCFCSRDSTLSRTIQPPFPPVTPILTLFSCPPPSFGPSPALHFSLCLVTLSS